MKQLIFGAFRHIFFQFQTVAPSSHPANLRSKPKEVRG